MGVGTTDVKAETPNFGHLIRRIHSFEKTLILGKIEGRRRRGQQRIRVGGFVAINYLHQQKTVFQFSHGMKARIKSDREFTWLECTAYE